jgi:hypothetical protein
VTDSGLVSLSKGCCGLQKLSLGDLRGCSRQGLTAVARTCAQLTELDLWTVSVPFAAFAQGCPCQTYSSLRCGPDRSRTRLSSPRAHQRDIFQRHECFASRRFGVLSRLRELNVACCHDKTDGDGCRNGVYRQGAPDATITILYHRCPNLRDLTVCPLYS